MIPSDKAISIMKQSCANAVAYAGPDVHAYTSFLYGVWICGGGSVDEFQALMRRCIAFIRGKVFVSSELAHVTHNVDEAARVILIELKELEPTVRVVME